MDAAENWDATSAFACVWAALVEQSIYDVWDLPIEPVIEVSIVFSIIPTYPQYIPYDIGPAVFQLQVPCPHSQHVSSFGSSCGFRGIGVEKLHSSYNFVLVLGHELLMWD